jgi:hypothetical protein
MGQRDGGNCSGKTANQKTGLSLAYLRAAPRPRFRVRLEHIQSRWKLNVRQLYLLIAFPDGKPVPTFPGNGL